MIVKPVTMPEAKQFYSEFELIHSETAMCTGQLI